MMMQYNNDDDDDNINDNNDDNDDQCSVIMGARPALANRLHQSVSLAIPDINSHSIIVIFIINIIINHWHFTSSSAPFHTLIQIFFNFLLFLSNKSTLYSVFYCVPPLRPLQPFQDIDHDFDKICFIYYSVYLSCISRHPNICTGCFFNWYPP